MALHRLLDVVREVPTLDATRAFYREFGLTETRPGVFATVVGGEQLRLRHGPVARVVSIGVGVDAPADLAALASRLTAFGAAPRSSDGALTVTEPVTGVTLRFTVAPRLPPERPPRRPARPRRDDLVPREPVRPRRLGHVVLGTPDVAAGERFFVDGVGMRLSDHVAGGPFMRFETDHHNIVLLPAPVPLLHHTAWKVRDVDEIGYGGSQMIENHPERHAWGLGRHAASANYFWYLKDPAGAFAEYYYSEMDEQADSPLFWDPVPDPPELPIAVWASPPLVPAPLTPDIPEAMPAPLLAGRASTPPEEDR